jgi:hypothetical protein
MNEGKERKKENIYFDSDDDARGIKRTSVLLRTFRTSSYFFILLGTSWYFSVLLGNSWYFCTSEVLKSACSPLCKILCLEQKGQRVEEKKNKLKIRNDSLLHEIDYM